MIRGRYVKSFRSLCGAGSAPRHSPQVWEWRPSVGVQRPPWIRYLFPEGTGKQAAQRCTEWREMLPQSPCSWNKKGRLPKKTMRAHPRPRPDPDLPGVSKGAWPRGGLSGHSSRAEMQFETHITCNETGR